MFAKIVLLVEDNPDDVELTLRAFKKNNIANKVIVVNDGEEALDYIYCKGKYSDRSQESIIAVVLLDLKLPKVDGLEVIKKIRATESTKTIPVVVLTSSKEEEDVIKSYRMGANSYIRKPVDFSQFLDSVKQLGLYWLLLNELPPMK